MSRGSGAGFTVVHDPQRIYTRGAQFSRQDMAHTLYLACWPPRLVVRDLEDDKRYEVEPYRTRMKVERQRLVALARDAALVPTGNGGGLARESHDG